MKLRYLITLFIMHCALYITYAQATYDSVAAFTDKTTIGLTDIFPFQTKVANKYTWRKITGENMFNRITDTTEARVTALLAADNTWSGVQTFSDTSIFNGATFKLADNGAVHFLDSTTTTGLWTNWLHRGQAVSYIGWQSEPFLKIYSKEFCLVNTGGDTASISIDDTDGSLTIPNLTVTETITIDSSATFNTFAFTPHSYTVPNVGDTVLTLLAANRYSLIELDLPGDITTGISRLYVEGAQKGMVIRLYNGDASYEMKFKDYVAGDDNLYLTGDFTTMLTYDYIELMCVVESIIGQTWMETGRSNN